MSEQTAPPSRKLQIVALALINSAIFSFVLLARGQTWRGGLQWSFPIVLGVTCAIVFWLVRVLAVRTPTAPAQGRR